MCLAGLYKGCLQPENRILHHSFSAMRFYLIVFLLQIFSMGKAQPFSIGHVQRSYSDPTRANRSVPCEIYYPATQAGEGTPFSNGKFPVIAFGHGYVMPWSVYDIYWQNLVPQGFILIFPTTESGFSPSHLNFGKDLAFACQKLKQEGVIPASLFFNHIDSASAVMGHSMGGGAAFLAMLQDSTISAFATVAAAETNPSAVAAAGIISRPSLVFSGANDCVTPPSAHQIPMYNALNSSQKSLVSITGGNHCQFASSNFNCSLGQSTCSPQATINAAQQQGKVFQLLIPWLRFYLKSECPAGEEYQDALLNIVGISLQQAGQLNCTTTEIASLFADRMLDYSLNSSLAEILIRLPAHSGEIPFRLFDACGRLITAGNLYGQVYRLETGGLRNGLYFFQAGSFLPLHIRIP